MNLTALARAVATSDMPILAATPDRMTQALLARPWPRWILCTLDEGALRVRIRGTGRTFESRLRFAGYGFTSSRVSPQAAREPRWVGPAIGVLPLLSLLLTDGGRLPYWVAYLVVGTVFAIQLALLTPGIVLNWWITAAILEVARAEQAGRSS